MIISLTSYDIVQNGVPIGQSARNMLRDMKTDNSQLENLLSVATRNMHV